MPSTGSYRPQGPPEFVGLPQFLEFKEFVTASLKLRERHDEELENQMNAMSDQIRELDRAHQQYLGEVRATAKNLKIFLSLLTVAGAVLSWVFQHLAAIQNLNPTGR